MTALLVANVLHGAMEIDCVAIDVSETFQVCSERSFTAAIRPIPAVIGSSAIEGTA